MTSRAKREQLAKEIKQIRKDIRRKHANLTQSAISEQQELEKQLEPIVQPLKKLINLRDVLYDTDEKMDDVETRLKKHKRRGNKIEEQKEVGITPIKMRKIGSITSTPEMDVNEGATEIYETPPTLQEVLSTSTGLSRANYWIDNAVTGKLPRLYLRKLFNDKNKEIDHTYGVYFGDDDSIKIGNSTINFEGDNIIIDNVTYEGTPGLYELLFMKIPDDYIYSEEDLHTYGLILKATNAHKQSHSDRVKSNKGHKYNNIIKNLVSESTSTKSKLKRIEGRGVLSLTNDDKPNYVYWDDPNELCDRLRLLIASKNTGHSGHENEIISIIEELREANIIK